MIYRDEDRWRMTKTTHAVTIPVKVLRGSSAKLPCDLTPSDPLDPVYIVLWFREESNIPIYTEGRESLRFRVEYSACSCRSTTVKVLRGSSAKLPCDLTPSDPLDPVYIVLWFREESNIPIYTFDVRGRPLGEGKHRPGSSSISSRSQFDQSSLIIDPVNEDDRGTFVCRVDFRTSPTKYTKVQLVVIVPPEKPKILYLNGTRAETVVGPYNEGEALYLVCETIGGEPLPNVTWTRGGKEVDATSEILGSRVINRLEIQSLTREHFESVLTCEATNYRLSVPEKDFVTIDMNLRPLAIQILTPGSPMSAGREYQMACEVFGSRPQPSVTWTLHGKPLDDHRVNGGSGRNISVSILTLKTKKSDDGATLRCQARNPAAGSGWIEDSAVLGVRYAPELEIALGRNLNGSQIKEGDDVYFECNVDANPDVQRLHWTLDGKKLDEDLGRGIIFSPNTLVLQKVKRSQSGNYRCHARNPEGEGSSRPLRLAVRYAPVCRGEQKTLVGVSLRGTVNVTCSLDARPLQDLTFHWGFNTSTDVVEVSKRRTSASNGTNVLLYSPRTEFEFGTLLCWGQNSVGTQLVPCAFQVLEAGPPEMPSNCSLRNQTTRWLSVTCEANFDGGLPQRFFLELFDAESGKLRKNVTSPKAEFHVESPIDGGSLTLVIYAANDEGRSKSVFLDVRTAMLLDRRQGESSAFPPPLTPFLGIVSGVVGLSIVSLLVARLVYTSRRRERAKRNQEGNPDLIHACPPGKEPEGGAKGREEEAFLQRHVIYGALQAKVCPSSLKALLVERLLFFHSFFTLFSVPSLRMAGKIPWRNGRWEVGRSRILLPDRTGRSVEVEAKAKVKVKA
ncbi:unnamed protein product [Darwinula stevensoni]|uniref:Ig-like domain-containing protein n=1 Tax=Darwinula stevensoni TaxID=69355 RepID=A0A7R8X6G0_9CRUS|nr:unnamed protein product [Darwinula stevensoni]CAG0879413.1 unnamed protein product [Darwinula stevensoni]